MIEVNLRRSCHPGYDYENERCECQLSQEVIHCDSTNRYVYIRVSVQWTSNPYSF